MGPERAGGTLALMGRTGCFVLALACAAALAAAAVLLAWVVTRDPEPATIEDALAAFRTELAGRAPVEEPLPEGVYVYATDGYERTDALTGVTNRYPSRTTITVVRRGCGLTLRWDVTSGRSTTWTVCVEPDGWRLASQDERHTFFGRTERTTYVCSDTPYLPLVLDRGAGFAISCSTGSARERGSGRVLGRRTLRVGGEEVEVTGIARSTELTGSSRGRTRHELWLDERGLPVQVEMETRTANDAPVGEVRYEEDVALRLESLAPRR
ncbi:MAG: hypothetical protein KatS3mg012_0382 [Gaiellaceae bacterium]|nr:MAG: hypothetical protein KatS3mg012_0382 [Gaiellaceae bacterium]